MIHTSWETRSVTSVHAPPEDLSSVGYSNSSLIRTKSDTSGLELQSETNTWAWTVLVSAEQTCQTCGRTEAAECGREKPKWFNRINMVSLKAE